MYTDSRAGVQIYTNCFFFSIKIEIGCLNRSKNYSYVSHESCNVPNISLRSLSIDQKLKFAQLRLKITIKVINNKYK